MTLSVFDAASEAPDRTALIVGDRAISFAGLADLVRATISSLGKLGIPSANRVPTWMIGSADLPSLVRLHAFMEVGQPVALVHPRLTDGERAPIVAMVEQHRNGQSSSSPSTPPAELDDKACLAIVFTSGTTGRPKGIVLSRRAFLASARGSAENLGWQDRDRWLLGLPLAHVGGLSIVTRCLIARRTVVVPQEVAEGRRLDARGIARAIESEHVTLVSLVPTQLEWLLSLDPPWRPPPYLRAVLLGGAPARRALLERAADLGIPVLTTYGLTEACSQVTTQPYGSVNRGDMGAGAPLRGTDVRLASDGAVEIRGATLLSGYFPDSGVPFDEHGWFQTDDIGRLDEHGMLHLVGRRSELIVTGGENVYPSDVETVLERCAAVSGACVFGIPDDTWGEVVAAAVVAAGTPDVDGIAAFARANLASHRLPRLISFVEALVTGESGKLDRRATAALARARLQPLPDIRRSG